MTEVGEWSDPYFTTGIRTTDETPPTMKVNGRPKEKLPNGTYKGTVFIEFSEPVYYVKDNGDGTQTAEPLTAKYFYEHLNTDCEISDKNLLGSAIRFTTVDGRANSPVRTISFWYSKASRGSTIVDEDLVLCDKSLNVAGYVRLDFDDSLDTTIPEPDPNNPTHRVGFVGSWTPAIN